MQALLVPRWPAPANVRAVFTTRDGGVSAAPFESLNLGDHVGDDPLAVARNRALLAQAMGVRPVYLQQVHGVQCVQVDAQTSDGTQADSCVSGSRGVACTIMVADCLPVLLTNLAGTRVAAAHAGWRGLVNGVLAQNFKHFMALEPMNNAPTAIKNIANLAPDEASGVLAWLGPCIGPACFEVGSEVREAFVRSRPQDDPYFVSRGAGKYLADLAALARGRLRDLGVTQMYGNDSTPPWCTVANASSFFSHRRDAVRIGGSGRMAACIWLE